MIPIILMIVGIAILLGSWFIGPFSVPNAVHFVAFALLGAGVLWALVKRRWLIAIVGVVLLVIALGAAYSYVERISPNISSNVSVTSNVSVADEGSRTVVQPTGLEILNVQPIEDANGSFLRVIARIEGPEGIYQYSARSGGCESEGNVTPEGYSDGYVFTRILVPCSESGAELELTFGPIVDSYNVSQ